MRRSPAVYLAPFVIAALALSGCAPAVPAGGGNAAPGTTQNSGGSLGTKGNATVTANGQTWKYDYFLCAVGYERTDSDDYSFSATAFKTVDDVETQFLIDVIDDSGQDRVSGDGVEYQIVISDHTPAVDINAFGTTGVEIAGDTVKISGTFDNRGESVSIEADILCNH